MSRLILPRGLYIGILIVVGILVGVQFGINEWVLYEAEVGQVTCKVHDVDKSSSYLKLEMNCDGKEASTTSVDVVLSWVLNPGPLSCTLYKRGNISCEPRGAPQ